MYYDARIQAGDAIPVPIRYLSFVDGPLSNHDTNVMLSRSIMGISIVCCRTIRYNHSLKVGIKDGHASRLDPGHGFRSLLPDMVG